jgi:hypothetical protein
LARINPSLYKIISSAYFSSYSLSTWLHAPTTLPHSVRDMCNDREYSAVYSD